jgi:two-component system chemotaxis response regulator CheB
MIRILIAEDSKVIALLLKGILEAEPDMKVVGVAEDGVKAIQMARDLSPDLVTMDIHMPQVDGFAAIRTIMAENPVPIVVVSSLSSDTERDVTFRAFEEGAVAVIEKPHNLHDSDFERTRKQLVETVRAMAEVKVVKRRLNAQRPVERAGPCVLQPRGEYKVLAIGCSTGGPQVLHRILSALPADFPIPVVVVQHITHGFIGGLVEWLQGHTALKVKLAENGEQLRHSSIYFAPDDYHLLIAKSRNGFRARLENGEPVRGFMPSVDQLLHSIAQSCSGQAIGILLTGMGDDGARGLLEMKRSGCHTLIQDEASSVVFGMAGSALALGAVDRIVALKEISGYLANLAYSRGTPDNVPRQVSRNA